MPWLGSLAGKPDRIPIQYLCPATNPVVPVASVVLLLTNQLAFQSPSQPVAIAFCDQHRPKEYVDGWRDCNAYKTSRKYQMWLHPYCVGQEHECTNQTEPRNQRQLVSSRLMYQREPKQSNPKCEQQAYQAPAKVSQRQDRNGKNHRIYFYTWKAHQATSLGSSREPSTRSIRELPNKRLRQSRA